MCPPVMGRATADNCTMKDPPGGMDVDIVLKSLGVGASMWMKSGVGAQLSLETSEAGRAVCVITRRLP
jgi:hypothetical protein